jgi:hypothetical protein
MARVRFIHSNIAHLRVTCYDSNSNSDIPRSDNGLGPASFHFYILRQKYSQRSAHVTLFLLLGKHFFGKSTVINKTLVHFRFSLLLIFANKNVFGVFGLRGLRFKC